MKSKFFIYVAAVLLCTILNGSTFGYSKNYEEKSVAIEQNYTKIRVTDYVNIRFSPEAESITIKADKKSINNVNITYVNNEIRFEIGNYYSTRITQPAGRFCEVTLPLKKDVTEYYLSGTSTIVSDSTLNVTALFVSNGACFEAPITNRECYIVGTDDSKIYSEIKVSTFKIKSTGNIDAKLHGRCSVCDIQAHGTTTLSTSRKYITADHIKITTSAAARVTIEALKAIRGEAYGGSIITCFNNPEELDIKHYEVSQVLTPDVPRIPEKIE